MGLNPDGNDRALGVSSIGDRVVSPADDRWDAGRKVPPELGQARFGPAHDPVVAGSDGVGTPRASVLGRSPDPVYEVPLGQPERGGSSS